MLELKDFHNWLRNSHNYSGGAKGFDDKGVLRISATDLCKSPQQVRLSIAYADELPQRTIKESFRANVGTIIHSSFEQYFKENYVGSIVEERREVPFGLGEHLMGITGQVDMIYEGQLYDLKTRSTYSEGKDDTFQIQGSIYRHLLFGDVITSDTLVLVNLWHDWKDKEDNPEYPITLEEVPLLSRDETIQYVQRWFEQFFEGTGECTPEQRWETETTYAVQKPGAARAYRTYQNESDAIAKCPTGYEVVTRPGRPVRCEKYCAVAAFCPQHKEEVDDDRRPDTSGIERI